MTATAQPMFLFEQERATVAPAKKAPARKSAAKRIVPSAPPPASQMEGERRFEDEVEGVEDTCWRLMREMTNPLVVARFCIDGEPVSKARPRFVQIAGRVKTYTPKKTRDSENEVAWHFRQARPGWEVDGSSGFGVFAVFFADTFQRRDVDNMLKLVLDALNGVVWADDSQVTEISGRQERGGERFSGPARTAVLIYRTLSNAQPTRKCEGCDNTFVLYKSQAARKFCSRDCSGAARRGLPTGKKKVHKCARCGEGFTLTRNQVHKKKYCSDACHREGHTTEMSCAVCSAQFKQWTSWAPEIPLCSKECGVAYWRTNGAKIPKGNCEECGGPVSRREYKRCRACVRASSTGRSRGPMAGGAA